MVLRWDETVDIGSHTAGAKSSKGAVSDAIVHIVPLSTLKLDKLILIFRYGK